MTTCNSTELADIYLCQALGALLVSNPFNPPAMLGDQYCQHPHSTGEVTAAQGSNYLPQACDH